MLAWEEPVSNPVLNLCAPTEERAKWYSKDLQWVIFSAMTYAMHKSAGHHKATCYYQWKYDGFYYYKGDLDVRYTADAIAQAVREKMRYDDCMKTQEAL